MNTDHSSREAANRPEEENESRAESIQYQSALIVGIGAYGAGMARLANAADDARGMADCLRHDYGIEVNLLLDERATLVTLQQVIAEELARADAGRRWLFYFAGHGTVVEQTGYLLPMDARLGAPDTYLPLSWLLDRCRTSACAEILILLDACYAGRAMLRPDDLSDVIPEGAEGERVRQLITSGNPDQPVLDGGGSGHSVFTQSLLDALNGWAGIHESGGAIRFTRLLDHLVFEVPGRLRALGLSAARQQPIGGNLSGNRQRRDFVLGPIVPRLPPEIVLGTHSDDPTRRREDLARLIVESQTYPERKDLAVQLALRHLPSAARAGTLITHTLRYEPAPEVRAQAATTLGELNDTSTLESLIAALDDAPDVVRAVAHALGQMADPSAAPALLDHLRASDDALFLDLVSAIGAIGDSEAMIESLRESLLRGRLVPFVGPDFPQELTGLPDRVTLARKLAEREGLPAGDSLAVTAAGTLKDGNRFVFTEFLRRMLDDQQVRPGKIHQVLARLPIAFWLSGAYDNLLIKALNANQIVMGGDTQYWRPNRPTVVRLSGDLSGLRGLLVVESDYEQLRENEGDRNLLVSYLRNEVRGKVLLLIGYDPSNPDTDLLNRYLLNKHFAEVEICTFLVWPGEYRSFARSGRPIYHLALPPQELLARLAGAKPT